MQLLTGAPVITRSPLRDQVYKALLASIQSGELPAGKRVRDTDIALKLGVSRTPVREALLQLAREGVLQADTGRGFSMRGLDAAEMRETGVMLSALEQLAVELSESIPPERLVRLGAIDREVANVRGNVDRSIDLDEEWHRTLIEGCPNARLRAMISTLWQVPRRYMRAYLRDGGRVSLSTQHHARIAEALRRDDRSSAILQLKHHWQRGIEELEGWIER
jgi:DNA-binding GntR family transcriptional regulator